MVNFSEKKGIKVDSLQEEKKRIHKKQANIKNLTNV